MKAIFKRIIQGIFLTLLFPCALLAVFGRFRIAYEFFAQACALVPGLPGDYARGAFYKDSRIRTRDLCRNSHRR